MSIGWSEREADTLPQGPEPGTWYPVTGWTLGSGGVLATATRPLDASYSVSNGFVHTEWASINSPDGTITGTATFTIRHTPAR